MGNDVFAVYNATKEARRLAVEEHTPVLIEAMTYRKGHHSTSDDSSAYRSRDEVSFWDKEDNPITRLRKYLERREWWSEEKEKALKKTAREAILKSFAAAEQRKKPALKHMFTEVYDELPPHLEKQRAEVAQRIADHPEVYAAAVAEHAADSK